MPRLTTSEVQFYRENGYLRLDRLATPEEALVIRSMIVRLFEERAGEREGAFGDLIAGDGHLADETSPQILNPVNYAPELHKTQCFKDALSIARQILGDKARFFLDLSIQKKPRIGAATPWHQDEAFRDPRFEYEQLTIWLALQDVNLQTACMQFVPGSHKRPVLEHRSVNDDPTSQALQCTDSIDASTVVSCPLPLGGCTIHHAGTLHCAGPNVSTMPRFAYIMTFGVPPKLAKGHRDFKWLEGRETPFQGRKRRWMRRGGFIVTAWRRLRRGDLVDWQSAAYFAKRAIRVLRSGS